MIRINLLPKEERVRRRTLPTIRIPNVGAAVPFVVLAGLIGIVATIATIQAREVKKLETQVAEAHEESARYRPQLEKIRQITQKRQEVRNRLDIIAKLDRERYYRVQLMDELSKSLPDNMWLESFSELGDRKFQLDGVTFSNFNVARLMDNLEKAEHWQKVDLSVAQKGTIDELDVVQFSLTSGAKP